MDARRSGVVAAGVGLAFVGLWLALYPAHPLLPTADAYAHLSVARHLVQGDGFLIDMAYPLTTAFTWGRQIPQPLTYPMPGFAVILTVPYLLAGGDPAATVAIMRITLAVLLGVAVAIGSHGLVRRGATPALPAWILILLFSPLLALATNWGWTEVPASVILLGLWLRWRDRATTRATLTRGTLVVDGLVAGALTMLRLDLLWIPVLWWRGRLRGLGWVALGWLIVCTPWFVRTTIVTGSPVTNVPSQAVELDMQSPWWTYPMLRGLTPVPLLENLRAHPHEALVKVRHGIRFFAETLGQWLPWLLWLIAMGLGIRSIIRGRTQGGPSATLTAPLVTLALTLAFLVLQYALFSQEVRHLLVLLPSLSWELALGANDALPRHGRPWTTSWSRALILTAAIAAALVVTPPGIGGEQNGVDSARHDAPRVAALTRKALALPPGPAFSDNDAVLWYSNRPGISSPRDTTIEAAIRTTVPGMSIAPWLRLFEQ